MAALVTRQRVAQYVVSRSRDKVEYMIGRACLVLARNQTVAERMSGRTLEDNGRGFSKFDARKGVQTAEMFAKFGAITEEQLSYWTAVNDKGIPRIAKYWRQLNEAAEKKRLG